MGTADNTAAGVRIRKWDEVGGISADETEPGVTPQDHMDGPLLQTGNRNYLRTAEEQSEDDYSSIDGIINNGTKDSPAEKTGNAEDSEPRKSVMDKIREQEEKQRSFPYILPADPNPEIKKDPLCPERSLC